MIIYLVLVAWVLTSSLAPFNTILKNRFVSSTVLLSIITLLIFSIPFNDFSDGDMSKYLSALPIMRELSFLDSWNYFEWEPLFIFLQWTFSKISLNENFYIIYIASIYIFIYYLISKNLFYNWQRLFFFFSYISFTFFYSYLFNGTRQGFSMALILLAISIWNKENIKFRKIKIILCFIAATLFHSSAIPVAILIIFIMITKISIKKLVFIWILFAALYLSGANIIMSYIPLINNIDFFSIYSNDELIDYYGGSNKLDFLLFSLEALLGSLFL